MGKWWLIIPLFQEYLNPNLIISDELETREKRNGKHSRWKDCGGQKSARVGWDTRVKYLQYREYHDRQLCQSKTLDWQTRVVVPLRNCGTVRCSLIKRGSKSSNHRSFHTQPPCGKHWLSFTSTVDWLRVNGIHPPVSMCFVNTEKLFGCVPQRILWGLHTRGWSILSCLSEQHQHLQVQANGSCLEKDSLPPALVERPHLRWRSSNMLRSRLRVEVAGVMFICVWLTTAGCLAEKVFWACACYVSLLRLVCEDAHSSRSAWGGAS